MATSGEERLLQAPVDALRVYASARGLQEVIAIDIYEKEVDRLGKAARIQRFVPVLAEKHTKEILRMSAGRKPA